MRTLKFKKLKRIHGVHFAPDGKRLLGVGGEEARMVDSAVWLDLATGENLNRIDTFADCYAVDPAASRFVLFGISQWRGGGRSVQWTPLTGPVDWQPLHTPRGRIAGAAFDPTGTRLVVSTLRALPGQPARSASDLHVLTLDPDAKSVRHPAEDSGQILAFNADGTRLALTGGIDWEPDTAVYDTTTWKRLFHLNPPNTVSRAVAFLPDNRLVVANGRNVYVLPADGGKPQFVIEGHPKQVNAVAVTPDGRRLLSASHDGTIRTWNADTGAAEKVFDWKIGPVTAVAFAPDGLTCAAAGLNGKVVIWDVDG